MNSSYPLISVIIPAYNAERYIAETLDSVLSQTYKNIEVLVVDDGSQDRTAAIIRSFSQRDRRVTLLQQANAGVAAARNFAIEKSRGEYIAPLDADDTWHPQKLEKQAQCLLQAEASVGLVYAWSIYIGQESSPTGGFMSFALEGKVHAALVYCNFLGSASVPLIRRTCLERVGYYNCQLKQDNAQGCEDRDLYLRIAEIYEFRVVPEFLIGYRKVAGTMSCNYVTMAKSHHLVLKDVQCRHSTIPARFYRWSTSNFYRYLARQCEQYENHFYTVYWLLASLRIDYANFLSRNLFKVLARSLFKLVSQPLTNLIWSDHFSRPELKEENVEIPLRMSIDSTARTQGNLQECDWKPYSRIQARRWKEVLQNCQLTNSDPFTDAVKEACFSLGKGEG